ncbi:MAG: hypothetical protein Q9193_005251 [Seirophora villosa]
MFFVVFQYQVPASRVAIAGEYYSKLQPILHAQPGFISETPYASPYEAHKQVLIARFVDEAAETNWRLQHDHLRIEKKGREVVFDDYRLRVGPSMNQSDATTLGSAGKEGGGNDRIVCLYERPVEDGAATPPPRSVSELIDPVKGAELDVSAALVDVEAYQSEKSVVWILGCNSASAATIFANSVRRVQDDSVELVEVKRDYGKYDRKEAPEDADAAQNASVHA